MRDGCGEPDGEKETHAPLPGGLQLSESLYEELHEQAALRVRRRARRDELEVTDLVNEACLKLLRHADVGLDRSHLKAVGSLALKQVLIDSVRRSHARPALVDPDSTSISQHALPHSGSWNMVAFLELLEHLSTSHPRQGRVVEMLILGGMTQSEIAEVLGVTARTIRTDWRFARAWLEVHYRDQDDP